MSKKALYQINTLKEKIITYNDTIKTLYNKRNTIKENLDFSSNTDTDTLNYLQNKQLTLETQQQVLKQTIYAISNEIKKYKSELENLNIMHAININNEDTINNEELSRIEEQKNNVIIQHKLNLESSYNDKINLYNEMELIKNELELQKNKVSQIQIKSHSNRKQTLDELHKKKQNKINTQDYINNFKNNEITISNQIIDLENTNREILEFKKNIVNFNYDINYDVNYDSHYDSNCDSTFLLNYYNAYNTYNIDVNLPINDKIIILDKFISDNEKKINSLKTKYEKQQNINNISIKNSFETYNNSNRNKIFGYKDEFKIEKTQKQNLDIILQDITEKYTTFDDIIIGSINNDLLIAMNELENDMTRSHDRLNIMKNRIIDNFNNETEIKLNLIEKNNTKLTDLYNEFNIIIVELENVKANLKKSIVIINEIDTIDIEIKKYETIINQLSLDIIALQM